MSEKVIKIVHIEDEPEALRLLKGIVDKYIPNAEYIASASNLVDGLELINTVEFDLLFLDLQLPDGSGFSLIQNNLNIAKKVVLCTADETKGIEAIKLGVFYYILKPISINEVIEVIQKRYTQTVDNSPAPQQVKQEVEINLLENKIILPDINGVEIIPIQTIIRLEADQNYTNVYLVSGEKIVASKTLGSFEDMLKRYPFIRIHRSNLINADYIKRINKNEGGSVELTTGEILKVSESGRAAIKERLKL